MIHQIFVNLGKGELKDISQFNWSHEKTKIYCKNNNIPHTLWGKQQIEDLLLDYPQYKQLYDDFRYDIQRLDFARLLILYDQGGLYLDLDINPLQGENIDYIFEKEFFIARWVNSNLPYNAIIACKKQSPLMLKCIEEVKRSYYEKAKMKIYHTRKARFVFQTTGHYALHRAIKKEVEYEPVVSVYNSLKKICECCPKGQAKFFDGSASIWYNDDFKNTE
jgi:mannosyltransferase OCH1-like enzyme